MEKELKHIVSFSGGKDSTAMLIRMLEIGMRVDRIIFADTKYEFPEMYDYVDLIDEYVKRFGDYSVEIVKTDETLEKWIFGKISRGVRKGQIRGFPQTAFPCTWARESKVNMLNDEIGENYRYLGIALDEKHRMVNDYEIRGYKYPLVEWGWSEEDCSKYLKDMGLTNPLYDNFDRTGCWWCPKQPLRSLEVLYNDYSDKWECLLEMDKRIKRSDPNRRFKADYELVDLDERFRKGE